MSLGLYDLRPTHNPHRWFLPITEAVCVGLADQPFMFGGVGLAACVEALEKTCGRPVVWASAQYLSFARPPAIVDLDVRIPVNGRSTTQARVVAHVRDQEILTVNAALGERPGRDYRQWVSAPEAPPPDACRPAERGDDEVAGVHDRMDVRIARGRFRTEPLDAGPDSGGRMALWMRSRVSDTLDAGVLAVMADYLPSALSHALGEALVASSLDNTIRFTGLEPTDWVLCDIQVEAQHRGFAQGTLHMFSDTGKLMAIGSQSMIVRRLR